jgi:hypothetical protein
MGVRLFPYSNIDGKWTLDDTVMEEIYESFVDDGTLDSIFYNRPVNKDWFVSYFKQPNNLPIVAMYDDKLAGIAWLNGLANKWAFAHFGMLRPVYGAKAIQVANYILSYWFNLKSGNGEMIFDTLVGITPRDHEKALAFIQKIGFQIVGAIPNICAGTKDGTGIVSFIAR